VGFKMLYEHTEEGSLGGVNQSILFGHLSKSMGYVCISCVQRSVVVEQSVSER
jgi:hypothetical protein